MWYLSFTPSAIVHPIQQQQRDPVLRPGGRLVGSTIIRIGLFWINTRQGGHLECKTYYNTHNDYKGFNQEQKLYASPRVKCALQHVVRPASSQHLLRHVYTLGLLKWQWDRWRAWPPWQTGACAVTIMANRIGAKIFYWPLPLFRRASGYGILLKTRLGALGAR